jgi:UDP-N-acetylglucosamine/UDP-N-acetylgalactosamine diphosphorylase
MASTQDLAERLEKHGQERLLRHWSGLDGGAHAGLAAEIASIDFDQLSRLVVELVKGGEGESADVDTDRGRPPEVVRLPQTDAERADRRRASEIGEEALAAGEVGVVVVAGGSGTRLGFPGPKGTFPIGPVSSASLFQIHAEKVVALGRRHGKQPPLYVMTSHENHAATVRFFDENDRFGLDHVRFFVQGRMPAVDLATGEVLLAGPGRIAMSPDGHGGTLAALAEPGEGGGPSCLAEMADRGVRTLFYFQVDNPMVEVAAPTFIGLHRRADAEMSLKVIEKLDPDEKVGVVVEIDGRPRIIEYSDLPRPLAEARRQEGQLAYWAGSIAIHVLERSFVERLVGVHRLPFHRAVKKVPYLDRSGELVIPDEPNAVKFERFIFDALPEARGHVIVETDRVVEFEPLKNAVGPDSPATVHQRMSDLFGSWLEQAGAVVPRRPDGSIPFAVEISPLYALDTYELKAKVEAGTVVERPIYLR